MSRVKELIQRYTKEHACEPIRATEVALFDLARELENERDNYIKRIAELEKENAMLRAMLRGRFESVKAGLND